MADATAASLTNANRPLTEGEYLAGRRRQDHAKSVPKTQRPAATTATAAAVPDAELIKRTYVRLWQSTHELLEGAAFALMGADLLIIASLAFNLYVVRLIGSTVFGGGPTITFRGVRLSLIPSFGIAEGIYRTVKNLVLAAVVAVVYSGVLFVLYLITHPGEAFVAIACKFIGPLLQLFGVQCVSNVPTQ